MIRIVRDHAYAQQLTFDGRPSARAHVSAAHAWPYKHAHVNNTFTTIIKIKKTTSDFTVIERTLTIHPCSSYHSFATRLITGESSLNNDGFKVVWSHYSTDVYTLHLIHHSEHDIFAMILLCPWYVRARGWYTLQTKNVCVLNDSAIGRYVLTCVFWSVWSTHTLEQTCSHKGVQYGGG
jgi:hypothetical protein